MAKSWMNVKIRYEKTTESGLTKKVIETIKNENVGANVGVNVGINLDKTQQLVYSLIKENSSITYIKLSLIIKKSEETIRKNIKVLFKLNLIRRVGSSKSGHWKIKE